MINPNAFYAGGIAVRSYDLFAVSPATAGDIAFYVTCAKRFGSDVLELGVGTGRVALPLAEAQGAFPAGVCECHRGKCNRHESHSNAPPR